MIYNLKTFLAKIKGKRKHFGCLQFLSPILEKYQAETGNVIFDKTSARAFTIIMKDEFIDDFRDFYAKETIKNRRRKN